MNFTEALKEVTQNCKTVWRPGQQLWDHDHPQQGPIPWHMWTRIITDACDPDDDEAIIFIQTRNKTDGGNWVGFWQEDNLCKEDVLAEDWEITEEED